MARFERGESSADYIAEPAITLLANLATQVRRMQMTCECPGALVPTERREFVMNNIRVLYDIPEAQLDFPDVSITVAHPIEESVESGSFVRLEQFDFQNKSFSTRKPSYSVTVRTPAYAMYGDRPIGFVLRPKVPDQEKIPRTAKELRVKERDFFEAVEFDPKPKMNAQRYSFLWMLVKKCLDNPWSLVPAS